MRKTNNGGGGYRRAGPGVLAFGATMVGTVVGAGFGSGQELLRFFTSYGPRGGAGLLLAVVLFWFAGAQAIAISHSKRVTSYHEILREACGRVAAPFVDLIVAAMFFGGLAVMIAAGGAVLQQEFGWPAWVGAAFMAIMTALTNLTGLKGITRVNTSVVMAMIVVIFLVCGVSLGGARAPAGPAGFSGPAGTTTAGSATPLWSAVDGLAPFGRVPPPAVQPATTEGPLTPGTSEEVPPDPATFRPAPWWPVSAFLYVAYNLLLAMGVLAPLAGACRRAAVAHRGALMAWGVLFCTAMASHLAMQANWRLAASAEVPMVQLAARMGPVMLVVYAVILWLEVYTTAVASLYGLTVRLVGEGRRAYPLAVMFFTVAALAVSGYGFSSLVGTLYPAFGAAGLWFLVGLLTLPWRRRHRARGGRGGAV